MSIIMCTRSQKNRDCALLALTQLCGAKTPLTTGSAIEQSSDHLNLRLRHRTSNPAHSALYGIKSPTRFKEVWLRTDAAKRSIIEGEKWPLSSSRRTAGDCTVLPTSKKEEEDEERA